MATSSFTKDIMSMTMDLKLSKADQHIESLTTLCTDILLIVIKMREAEDLGETSALRKLILYYIKEFDKNCAVMGVDKQTVEYVKYALIAVLDETVLSIPGQARDFWVVNPMQLELFGDNIAGREFYNKLDKLMSTADKHRDALEVYYLCLSLGFYGKYKLGNTEEREEIITNLAKILVKCGKAQFDTLSPHAYRFSLKNRKTSVKKAFFLPLWAIGTAMAGVTFAAWFVMRFVSGNNVATIVELLN
ncbi:type VI secretion system protein ImpK [Chitinispirillum alkaliphilum]|nr:type VI secretion system protein ImpK [Chitinispirillum alkaliphilum]